MRPLGVTLIALYQILRGVLAMLFALGIMLFAGLASRLAAIAAEGNAVERLLHSLGHWVGIVIVVFAFLHIVAGIGLFFMQNWARLLTLLFSALGLAAMLPGLVLAHGLALFFGIINAVVIIYLVMPSIKRAFHGKRATA